MTRLRCSSLIAVFWLMTIIPGAGWQLLVHKHHLSLVPAAMKVSSRLYFSERAWGFGPGANETGIIVYDMPAPVRDALKAGGLSYLERMPKNTGRGWQGKFRQWHETPLVTKPVKFGKLYGEWTSPGIADYLFRYGYIIPIDEDVERMVNKAIFNTGSYYAYGRTGLIILIPEAGRIVFAYRG